MTAAISVAKHGGGSRRLRLDRQTPRPRWRRTPRRLVLKPLVLVPEGCIAAGKMAQAILHGAQVIMVRGKFRRLPGMARAWPGTTRWPW